MGNPSTRNFVPEPDVRKMGFVLLAPVDQLVTSWHSSRMQVCLALRIDALIDGGCLSCRLSGLVEGGYRSMEASMLAMFRTPQSRRKLDPTMPLGSPGDDQRGAEQ